MICFEVVGENDAYAILFIVLLSVVTTLCY